MTVATNSSIDYSQAMKQFLLNNVHIALSTRSNNVLAGVFSKSRFRGDVEVLMRVKVGFYCDIIFEGTIFSFPVDVSQARPGCFKIVPFRHTLTNLLELNSNRLHSSSRQKSHTYSCWTQ